MPPLAAAVGGAPANGSTGSTGAPGAAATPVPASALKSGVAWPAAFRTYSSTSVWNIPMSNQTNPTLVSGSDSIIAHAIQSSNDSQQLRISDTDLNNGPVGDNDHPWFIATSTDPVVTVNCKQYCNSAPATMHIPAKARPGNNGGNGAYHGYDAHISVIQPDGTEVDTESTTWPSGDWGTSGNTTIQAGTFSQCGNFFTGSGTLTVNLEASTVGDVCLQGGQIGYNEAFSGINHALFLDTNCYTLGTYRYPASHQGDVACTDGQPSFVNGDHVWLDLTDAQVDALDLPGTSTDKIWQQNVLKALHHYGGYIGDHDGGPCEPVRACVPSVIFEDSTSYTALGLVAPWQSYAAANGWQLQQFGTAKYYQFQDPWNPLTSVGGWAAHLHIVDPCYAEGAC